MTSPTPDAARVITVDAARWAALLGTLYERDDTLGVRVPGGTYRPDETVDAYVLSAHAEAFQSADVDGDVWGTLEDLDDTAADEEEAWEKITAFYLDRGCVLLRVTGTEEREEWILAEELAARLGVLDG